VTNATNRISFVVQRFDLGQMFACRSFVLNFLALLNLSTAKLPFLDLNLLLVCILSHVNITTLSCCFAVVWQIGLGGL
jgi:hypothetical protein